MYFLLSRRDRWHRGKRGTRRRIGDRQNMYRVCRATYIHNPLCALCMRPGGRLNLHHRGRLEDGRHALLCTPCHHLVHSLSSFPPTSRQSDILRRRHTQGTTFRYHARRSLARITSRRYTHRGCIAPRLIPVSRHFLACVQGRHTLTRREMRAIRLFDPLTQTKQFLAALKPPDSKGGKHANHCRKT